MPVRTIYLPAPEVVADRAAWCPACQGRGVTGGQAVTEASDTVHILVDVLCNVCGGCGQADHDTCESARHIDWEPDVDEDETYWDLDRCGSCQGRKWNANQGFTQPDDPDEAEEVYVRMPCGCAEPDMVELEFVEDSVPADLLGMLTGAMATTQLVTSVAMAVSWVGEQQTPVAGGVDGYVRAMMSDPNLLESWKGADDAARVVAIIVYAQRAAEHGVSALAGTGRHYRIAEGAVEMVTADLADNPGQPLIPEQPGLMPRGRAGAFVSSWVCDSTEADVNKVRALCLLAAAAAVKQ